MMTAKDRLIKEIMDGRLSVLKGASEIGKAVGLSATKAQQALKAGGIVNAWRTSPKGRWFAILPRLQQGTLPLEITPREDKVCHS